MEKTFQKNIEALKISNTLLAEKLSKIKNLQRFEATQVGENPTDIDIFDHQEKRFLYQQNPRQAIAELLLRMQKKYTNQKILYFFGIGTGFFLQSQVINHNAKRIFVFEAEIEIIYIAFHLVDFSSSLQNLHLVLFYTLDFTFSDALSIFKYNHERDAMYYHLSRVLILQPYYTPQDSCIQNSEALLGKALQYTLSIKNATIDDTLKGLQQTIQNSELLCHSKPINTLEGLKPSEYAIIVSTGPSLDKQLKLLKSIQNYATIISVDASLPILEKNGIKPHFVTSFERDEPTAKFFQETSKSFHNNINFILSGLQHSLVFENIKGGDMYITFRPSLNKIALPEYGPIGYGASAANMALELVTFYLHNKKIVFIGQDLAYGKDFQTHANEHIFENNALLQEIIENNNLIEVEAYGGKSTTKTNAYWKTFKDGLEDVILNTHNNYFEIINATEGGARIQGTKEIPFGKICQKILKKKRQVQIKPKKPTLSPLECHKRFSYKIKALHTLGIEWENQIIELLKTHSTSKEQHVEKMLQFFEKMTFDNETNNFFTDTLFSIKILNKKVYAVYNLFVQDKEDNNFYENAHKLLIDFFNHYLQLHQEVVKVLHKGIE